jgi:hypothetical protein
MDDHVKRMKHEFEDLNVKIGKLESFFSTETFGNLGALDQHLLGEQLGHMRAYHATLSKRFGRALL